MIENLSFNVSNNMSLIPFSTWNKDFSLDFNCGCNATQLSLIQESNNLIPKVSFIILLVAFLFLLFEFVVMPYFKTKSFYPFFIGLFGWFGTCLIFFGMWLLMPFAFKFESVGAMAIPGIFLVVLIVVAMYFKRRSEVKKE